MSDDMIDLTGGGFPDSASKGVGGSIDVCSASARNLRRFISSVGFGHEDCNTRDLLQARARQAQETTGKNTSSSSSSSSNSENSGRSNNGGSKRVRAEDVELVGTLGSSCCRQVLAVFPTAHGGFLECLAKKHGHDVGSMLDRLAREPFPAKHDKWEDDSVEEVECGCCFGEVPFPEVTQCSDGHLFCLTCLKHFAEEQLFGKNNSNRLKCMDTSGSCAGHFPDSELRRALPAKEFTRWVEQEAASAVKAANLPDLFSCPFCGFSAELVASAKVFQCPPLRGGCGKNACRDCGRAAHPSVPKCEDVETDAGTKKRLAVEEAMTNARLRACTNPQCSTTFYKTEGCNKMTCSQCQWHMCYLCRAFIPTAQGYGHFCQTPHCQHDSCQKCPLFTDPIEDDRRAMREAAEKAKQAAAAIAAAAAAAAAASSSSSSSSSSSNASTAPSTRFTSIAGPRHALPENGSGGGGNVDVDKLLEDGSTEAQKKRVQAHALQHGHIPFFHGAV